MWEKVWENGDMHIYALEMGTYESGKFLLLHITICEAIEGDSMGKQETAEFWAKDLCKIH